MKYLKLCFISLVLSFCKSSGPKDPTSSPLPPQEPKEKQAVEAKQQEEATNIAMGGKETPKSVNEEDITQKDETQKEETLEGVQSQEKPAEILAPQIIIANRDQLDKIKKPKIDGEKLAIYRLIIAKKQVERHIIPQISYATSGLADYVEYQICNSHWPHCLLTSRRFSLRAHARSLKI